MFASGNDSESITMFDGLLNIVIIIKMFLSMETKNFVEIKNLNGYLINDMGVVFSKKSGKELKSNNGVIEFYVDGSKKKMNVAHLVLETFVGNPQNANRVVYKNGDRNDASLANIEWRVSNKPKSSTRRTHTNTSPSRQKEIAIELSKLKKQIKMLQREKDVLTQNNGMVTTIKDNMLPLVEGIVKGENISKLTKDVLGRMLSRKELSKHLEKQCGISLNDMVSIAKLYKAKPNFVEAIIRIQKNNKLKNVVFKNVA